MFLNCEQTPDIPAQLCQVVRACEPRLRDTAIAPDVFIACQKAMTEYNMITQKKIDADTKARDDLIRSLTK